MEDDGDGEYMDMGEEDEMFSSGQETVPGSKKRKGAGDKGGHACITYLAPNVVARQFVE